ncbi:cytochrome P450 [Cyathus striatus]|nr:cytochrome P450 [Cyathus striatus]
MPYAIGLQAASTAMVSAGCATQFTLAVIVVLLILLVTSAVQKDGLDEPASLPGNPFLAIFPFFRKRYDFLNWGFHATGQSIFQFSLLRNKVIVVSGESAREAFFTAKGLDLTEGFKILSGAIPMVRGVTSDLQTKRIALIHKRLANVQRNAPLSELIPQILEDSRRVMEGWGDSGIFDPFDNIYELIFQTTIRSLTSEEIADNPILVARLKTLYDTLDTGTTPATVLLPWLPTPAMLQKLWATKEIYDIVVKAVDAREKSGLPRNDTLQMLLDFGDEKLVVVGFIMGLLIAGARATGTTASWLMTFLAGHPEWHSKAAAEVDSLLASNLSYNSGSSSPQSLSSRLAGIPLEAWEQNTPILDAIIRETTRVAQPHTAMRRNLGPEFYINNKIIPTGAYVIYPFSDIHLDPEIYPDPWKFDPGRKESIDTPFGYVGWGGGKTLCLGTRLAKVELKLITAMYVLGFRHSVVDRYGRPSNTLPIPNWNDILLCRPQKGSFYLKYERTPVML